MSRMHAEDMLSAIYYLYLCMIMCASSNSHVALAQVLFYVTLSAHVNVCMATYFPDVRQDQVVSRDS